MPVSSRAAALLLALGLAGCGSGGAVHATLASAPSHEQSRAVDRHGQPQTIHVRPQAVEPTAGVLGPTPGGQAQPPISGVQVEGFTPSGSVGPSDPVGDPNAHAPPLSQVRRELRMELVAVRKTNSTYIDPLRFVSVWERTDQGVDAAMPVGAPILAPCRVKILGIEPDWYAGQPLIYFELLQGPQAGRIQYVAEQITDLARAGTTLQQGQAIARFAASGTGIEYGWSTPSGVTLAVATTGYEEGEMTPAGMWMRAWLNALGAGAGPNRH